MQSLGLVFYWHSVALRKESVDRNLQKLAEAINPSVALRKESVDRNTTRMCIIKKQHWSLSARRAWIEIIDDFEPSNTRKVALRKESVDRNLVGSIDRTIDIIVALRKESVDRNFHTV